MHFICGLFFFGFWKPEEIDSSQERRTHIVACSATTQAFRTYGMGHLAEMIIGEQMRNDNYISGALEREIFFFLGGKFSVRPAFLAESCLDYGDWEVLLLKVAALKRVMSQWHSQSC